MSAFDHSSSSVSLEGNAYHRPTRIRVRIRVKVRIKIWVRVQSESASTGKSLAAVKLQAVVALSVSYDASTPPA